MLIPVRLRRHLEGMVCTHHPQSLSQDHAPQCGWAPSNQWKALRTTQRFSREKGSLPQNSGIKFCLNFQPSLPPGFEPGQLHNPVSQFLKTSISLAFHPPQLGLGASPSFPDTRGLMCVPLSVTPTHRTDPLRPGLGNNVGPRQLQEAREVLICRKSQDLVP